MLRSARTALACIWALAAWLCHRHRLGSLHACRVENGDVIYECVECGLPVRLKYRDGRQQLPGPGVAAEVAVIRYEREERARVTSIKDGAAERRVRAREAVVAASGARRTR